MNDPRTGGFAEREGEAIREAFESLSFSDEQKERLAQRLAAGAPSAKILRFSPAKRRYRFAVAAAVVAAMALGGGAYAAAGGLVGVQQFADRVFNGAPAQTELLGTVGHPVGASAQSGGVTVTADAVMGDAHGYAVVYSISRDDGKPFEGVEPLENGLLPLGFDYADLNVVGMSGAYGESYFYDEDPSDNAIQYVEKMTVDSPAGGLMGKTLRSSFKGLFILPADGQRRYLAEGAWEFGFELLYSDVSVSFPTGQSIAVSEGAATLRELSVSPIALYLSWEEASAPDPDADTMPAPDVKVVMKDGSVVACDIERAGGSAEPGDGKVVWSRNVFFDRIIDPSQVESVQIGGASFKPVA